MKIFLTEMSYKRAKAIEKIEDMTHEIYSNIFKIIVFRNERTVDHWIGELNNKCLIKIFTDYSNLKGNNIFSYKDYYKILVEEPFISTTPIKHMKKWIEAVTKIEDNLSPSIFYNSLSIGELTEVYENIIDFMKNIISTYQENILSAEELKQKIRKYLWSK